MNILEHTALPLIGRYFGYRAVGFLFVLNVERFEEADFAVGCGHDVLTLTDEEKERSAFGSTLLWLGLYFVMNQVFETW